MIFDIHMYTLIKLIDYSIYEIGTQIAICESYKKNLIKSHFNQTISRGMMMIHKNLVWFAHRESSVFCWALSWSFHFPYSLPSTPFLPITTVSGIYTLYRRLDRGERLSRLSNVQPVIGLPVKVTGTREDAISAGDRDLPALLCSSVGQGGRFLQSPSWLLNHGNGACFRLVGFNGRRGYLLPANAFFYYFY